MTSFVKIICLILALIFGIWGAIHFGGASISTVFQDIYKGSLSDGDKISKTLVQATPLLFVGLAVYLGLRAGLFNIGADGQFVVGALLSAIVGIHVGGFLGIMLAVFLGGVAGAIWALPAGWIKAYRGGHEVITTIMLNSVAGFLVLGLVAGPLKAVGQDSPATAEVLTQIPSILVFGCRLNWAFAFALALPILVSFWRTRTIAGYNLEAVGSNSNVAKFAGIRSQQIILQAMVASGFLAGVAGAVQVMAFEGKFFPDISSGTGFDALGVALLAGTSPIGVIPAAIGLAVIKQATPLLQIDGVPKGLTQVLLGVFIVIGAAIRYRKGANSVDV